jgi:molecular chaperone GrpE
MNDESKTPEDQQPPNADDAAPEPEADLAAEHDATEKSFDELARELDEVKDRMLRAVADAENTRKRAEKEIADTRAFAVASFARDLLSVSDNLSRALDALSPEARESMGETGRNLLSGVELTKSELHNVLTRHGVAPIDAAPGGRFDPNVHQAAAQIPSEHPAGVIVEVIQPGWRIGERTLRAAMVAVSAGPAAGQASETGAADAGGGESEPGSTVDTKA